MFDVAVGERAISHMGHIKMMGAVQPFISGAISKTVNMPAESTVDDIADAYIQGWHLGLKALAIYRDGSKTAQALRTEAKDKKGAASSATGSGDDAPVPARHRLPRERESLTHKFSIAGHEGYITAGKYEDGSLGEIFLTDIGNRTARCRHLRLLIKQAHPEWSPAEAKSAMMTTAREDVVKEDGVTPADPFDMGAGHIQPGGEFGKNGCCSTLVSCTTPTRSTISATRARPSRCSR